MADEDGQECGYIYDHTEVVTYESPSLVQWYCSECGVEGEEEQ